MTQWVRFLRTDGEVGFGTLHGDHVVEHRGEMFASSGPTGRSLAKGTFTLLNPCQPSKIVALWNNYHALGAKLGKAAPVHPLFLIKPASCVIGPGEAIQRPLAYAGKIVFEGELGIVISRRCKDVGAAEAASYIFGYTCVNDVTAGEILNENGDFAQWCRSKGYDTFGCLGPAITTDFDWAGARIITRLDGVERQNYPLSDMIIAPSEIVSAISHDMTLLPGDVIAVGTSLGVGSMKDGATVEVEIDGIGVLSNTVRGAVAREPTMSRVP
jgi:2-keto-4-pentenoate hydratase/2-oxohepta-3-ene-1,7-dioic acid hydratase in catechol pathway